MTPHRLAKPPHKHTRKSFWGTISERSIAVLLKRAHANERSADTCAATDAAGFRSCGRGNLEDVVARIENRHEAVFTSPDDAGCFFKSVSRRGLVNPLPVREPIPPEACIWS